MNPVHLKRYKDIIAILASDFTDEVVAFHAHNLEVATISEVAFSEMTNTTVLTGENVILSTTSDITARQELDDWNNHQSTETKSGEIKFGIRSLTINVTQICNLKCHYCAAGGDGTYGDPVTQISVEKTFPQLKFFISQLQPGRKFNISFVGGEPLLYPEGINAICEYVINLKNIYDFNPVFSVVTNGTLINDRVLEILKNNQIHVTVSIDGPAEINDIQRSSKNGLSSTSLTITGLNKLNTLKSDLPSLTISAILNDFHQDLIAAYHFFRAFNPTLIELTLAYSQEKPELQKKYIESMNQIAQIAWANNKELGLRQIKTFDHYFTLLDHQQKVKNHCGAGKSYLMVDAKNQLYTCPWTVNDPEEVVGVGADLDYHKLEKYQKPLISLNNCQTCWAQNLCGGGCMYIHKTHTGSKHSKDPLFCERTRSLILTALLYYKLARDL